MEAVQSVQWLPVDVLAEIADFLQSNILSRVCMTWKQTLFGLRYPNVHLWGVFNFQKSLKELQCVIGTENDPDVKGLHITSAHPHTECSAVVLGSSLEKLEVGFSHLTTLSFDVSLTTDYLPFSRWLSLQVLKRNRWCLKALRLHLGAPLTTYLSDILFEFVGSEALESIDFGHVNVSSSTLQHILVESPNLHSLKGLQLDVDEEAIAVVAKHCSGLKHFHVRTNFQPEDDAFLTGLSAFSLKSLLVEWPEVHAVSFPPQGSFMHFLDTLTSVSFCCRHEVDATACLWSLFKLQGLKHLSFVGSDLKHPSHFPDPADEVETFNCNLSSITIQTGAETTPFVVDLLTPLLPKMHALHTLHLKLRNRKLDLKAICANLEFPSSLTDLNLDIFRGELTDSVVAVLATKLTQCSFRLIKLILPFCTSVGVTDVTLYNLAGVLQVHGPTLNWLTLDFTQTGVDGGGISSLSDALGKFCPHLVQTKLCFMDCVEIEGENVVQLCSVLNSLKHVKVVTLALSFPSQLQAELVTESKHWKSLKGMPMNQMLAYL